MRSRRPPTDRTAVTRRGLFAASAAGATAVATAGVLPGCGETGRAQASGRVVIVGSGLAGLIAAYELERDGLEVVLLEARTRPGGRLLTERNAFFAEQSAELGGEFVDRSHRVMLRYVRRLGLDLDDLRELGQGLEGVVHVGGRTTRYSDAVGSDVEAELVRFRTRLEELAAPLDPRDPAAAGAVLDRRSVADLVEELKLVGDARRLVEREIRDEYTVEADRLSLLFHASLTKLYARAPRSGTEAYRIDGGNERLLGALIDEIEAKVDQDAPVTAIEQRADGVTVSVDGAREVDGDYCIVTAPLRPLAEIDFRPALPAPVTAAARELQYGSATKTAMQYRRRVWAEEGFDGDAITDLAIGSTYEATNAQTGRPGILISYASGDEGRRFGAMPDSERITAAADQFEQVFPRVKDKLESGATMAWAQERYSRGSYAAYAPGQVVRFWRALRRPIGRVYLAGEHCDAYTGYMEGAVRSGRRVAREIAKRAS